MTDISKGLESLFAILALLYFLDLTFFANTESKKVYKNIRIFLDFIRKPNEKKISSKKLYILSVSTNVKETPPTDGNKQHIQLKTIKVKRDS